MEKNQKREVIEEELWRSNHGGGIMEEESLKRHH